MNKKVKVWQLKPGIAAAGIARYLEKLESEGWEIFQIFQTNEFKQVSKLLPVDNQASEMILVSHPLCFKYIEK